MTTEPAGPPLGGAAYRGFSRGAPDALRPAPRKSAWPIPRAVTAGGGVAVAVVLGLLLGFLAKPDLIRPAPTAPMRAVTASAEDASPPKVDIEVNRPAPPSPMKSAGRLDVLPPDLAGSGPRPAPASPPELAARTGAPLVPRLAQVEAPVPAPRAVATDPACDGARGRAAQMVCADPELSAADRELNRAYRRALRAGAAPEQLREEQRDWLSIREDAARHSPRAVADIYDQRIDELNRIADDGPG
jgi:uncharacterized protein YecT (DUF1311 family)